MKNLFTLRAILPTFFGLGLFLIAACTSDSDDDLEIVSPAANMDNDGHARSGANYPEADSDGPTALPTMVITADSTGNQELTEFSGSAPIHASFTSNVQNVGDYTPLYEWHVYKAGQEDAPYLVRTDADFDYEFKETGKSYISLQISFVNGTDTVEYQLETPFSVEAQSSVLNVPDAFSPNGDGINDTLRVKPDYRSIISFHGYVFNRQGVKLFEWTDITKGWDGTHNGKPVADGVYILKIEARGADGKHYKIKKAISLLRGYTYNSAAGTGDS